MTVQPKASEFNIASSGPRASKASDKQLGERIRIRRTMVKMSQADLGEALGVSFQQVQKYEKGVNRVGAGRLQQIAAALGESVEYFLGKDQDTSAEGLEMQRLLADRYVLRAARAFAKLDGDVRVHMLGLLESMGK